MALAVLVKHPVVLNTIVMPVENNAGIGVLAIFHVLFADNTLQYAGVTVPSAGALVALNIITYPALAPEVKFPL